MARAELATLLTKAREANKKVDVSGVLLFHERSFIQVLEGPAAEVERVFARISADARHDSVLVLERCETDTRQFAEWCMGAVELGSIEGGTSFLKDGHLDAASHATARKVLDAFRGGRFRQAIR